MIDLHAHILPGFDDGAIDLHMSMKMLDLAAADGITEIVATPHIAIGRTVPPWRDIVNVCSLLNQMAGAEGLPVTVLPGAEATADFGLLELLRESGAYCINGRRYLLVEMPVGFLPEWMDNIFFSLQTRGIAPVLAHPERHPWLQRQPTILLDWVRRGILLQINAGSLLGRAGKKAQHTAELWLKSGWVHAVASDSHNTGSRPPNLSRILPRITRLAGREYAQQLLFAYPRCITEGRDIPAVHVRNRLWTWRQRVMGWLM